MSTDGAPSTLLTGDSGTGTNLVDLLPLPADARAVTDPGAEEKGKLLADGPSLSHQLAAEDEAGHGDGKGHAQQGHDVEVVDLGWNERKENIESPLVGGIGNEELWLLVRRFNKQIYHVKEVTGPLSGGLDLNTADEDEFSPDKLRATLERLYMTVGLGLLAFVKHVARLRSWRERSRTLIFFLAYFTAWYFDQIFTLLTAVLLSLILFPGTTRPVLFPEAPVALVSGSTGGVQKPKAGVLGSTDSATGAPERHKGEAVEQEASNFVSGIASIALSSAAGKHPQGDQDVTATGGKKGDEEEDAEVVAPGGAVAPDPTAVAMAATDAKDKAAGVRTGEKYDKTKIPMETAMWTKMRPTMHALGDVADTWERVANALSPTPPFPKSTHRLRLAMLIFPLLGVSFFVTAYMMVKGAGFFAGVAFFSDPLLQPSLAWLNRRFPNWQKLLEPRNTILKGIPTNAQLTLTLLRLGEAHAAPLPPPPHVDDEIPPDAPAEVTDADLRATGSGPPLNATKEELDAAIADYDPGTKHATSGDDIDAAKTATTGSPGGGSHGGAKGGAKRASRFFLGLFRGTAKGAVTSAIGADTVRAAAGSHAARDRLGVVAPAATDDERKKAGLRAALYDGGPVEFVARYGGRKGRCYLATRATVPCLAFADEAAVGKHGRRRGLRSGGEDEEGKVHASWVVPVSDVAGLRKVGGYGWKARLVVGWAMGREVTDALEVEDRQGKKWMVTALPRRDELFNRLVAMGGQKWESR